MQSFLKNERKTKTAFYKIHEVLVQHKAVSTEMTVPVSLPHLLSEYWKPLTRAPQAVHSHLT